ncbi:unnamed protein product [Rotaria sp. Silwood1]|nr:unnamed protein product [Rotaria sp. Silwood1]CAF1634968.1 unnamed protein product [Rotaria sp. Silwood1]
MGNSFSVQNQNNINDSNLNNPSNIKHNTNYDTPTAINILQALFESENYCFNSFSSNDHGKIVKEIIENSQRQEQTTTIELKGDPILNEFVNDLYTIFSSYPSVDNINHATDRGMVKYEIYSIQSLNSLSSSTTNKQSKSIWLPKSMTIGEAHRILSTILYSDNTDTIPVDLADYVLVYENIMISLENDKKELYEEILKLSFRLNRVALPPFRLLVIHKSKLLLLERKESKPLLMDNGTISVLQLIMFHLLTNTINQLENENSDYNKTISTIRKDQDHEYWPITEIKMGIIPSSQLIHPLKYNKLCQHIAKIIQTNNLSEDIKRNVENCFKLLEKIFISVGADESHIKFVTTAMSKLVPVYDYPLLIALPYDRLLLTQFYKIRCIDDRYAQGIMANGKYFSLNNNAYTPMLELGINPGSIIQLKFNIQPDTIVHGNLFVSQVNDTKITDHCQNISGIKTNKFAITQYELSAEFDNNAVNLMFPTKAINVLKSAEELKQKSNKDKSKASIISEKHPVMNYLRSNLKSSSNWIHSSTKINESIQQIEKLNIEKTNPNQTTQNIPSNGNSLAQAIQTTTSSATLINKPSTSSLPFIDKPECLNCLSQLNDDNLECPHCTQVFCRICIESSCDNTNHEHYCPTCSNKVKLSEYRKSKIIDKFETEGISAFECFICHSIPEKHRLCLDPNCSALFCYDCWEKSNDKNILNTNQDSDSTGKFKCLQCKKADVYESNAVMYYSCRVIEYQIAEEVESKSVVSKSLPNTAWKKEDYLPEKGTLEENHNRIVSVIHFNDSHIQFSDKKEDCPLLIINEPPEYTCPESLRLSYWNTENEINRWEDDKNVQFYSYNQNSNAVYKLHFTSFTARNNRFEERIMLDKAFFDTTYDYDFTKKNDAGRTFQRGPEPYTRPCGWYRKAIKVLGKYENAEWLGTGTDAWPVGFTRFTAVRFTAV